MGFVLASPGCRGCDAPPPPPVQAVRIADAGARPALEARVVSQDATHYEIDLDVLVQALLGGLGGDLGVQPAAGGGFTITAIAPGSIFARLGLAQGDVLLAIDDVALTGSASLTSAYAGVRARRVAHLRLRRAGGELQIEYIVRRPPSPESVEAPLPLPAPAAAAAPDPDLAAAIRTVDEQTVEVRRSLIDRIGADPSLIARAARVVPSFHDGRSEGYRVFAIRPDSLFALLGLKNGDTILSVNGKPFTSPDEALRIFSSLRDVRQIVLGLRRRGESATLTIRIVEEPASAR